MSYLLIITWDDMKPCFEKYIRFKQAHGFEVELKTVEEIGEKADNIQAVLDSVPADKGNFFVLFGGLPEDVPTKKIQQRDKKGNIMQRYFYNSDNAYNKDGACRYYIGRFPTNVPNEMTVLCKNAIDLASKTANYNIMLVSGLKDDEERHSFIKDNLEKAGYNVSCKKLPGETDSVTHEAVNKDIICYGGHGCAMGWDSSIDSHIFNQFTGRSYMMGFCCFSGNYDDALNFGPELLRKHNVACYFGASCASLNTGDDLLEKQLLDSYVKRQFSTIGEWYSSNVHAIASVLDNICFNMWNYNLLGDPTLPLY